MMQLLLLTLNGSWIIGTVWLSKNNKLISQYGLRAQIALVASAFAGLNFLLGLILLFDLMESTADDLLGRLIDEKTTTTLMTMCFLCVIVNVVSGIWLVFRKSEKQFEN